MSCILDGCVKIWIFRVDSVVIEMGKLLSGLVGGSGKFDFFIFFKVRWVWWWLVVEIGEDDGLEGEEDEVGELKIIRKVNFFNFVVENLIIMYFRLFVLKLFL